MFWQISNEGELRKYSMYPLVVLLTASPASAAGLTYVGPAKITALSMFLNADWVVKSVMLLLLTASVVTWGVCLVKYLEFTRTIRAMKADERQLDSASSLGSLGSLGSATSIAIMNVAKQELSGCTDILSARSSDAMTERLSIRLSAVEGDAIQSMRTGFSVLASIGATAPFIGLFGTVWGIMNSFIGISQAQTTNLAVVAPGIAEALLATAMGLVAAIPAVLLYNFLARQMAAVRRRLHNMTSRVACLVSREVEQAQAGRR